MVIIIKKGNNEVFNNYTLTCLLIKHLSITHENTNEKATEDTRRKPGTRASWIQKQIFYDISQEGYHLAEDSTR